MTRPSDIYDQTLNAIREIAENPRTDFRSIRLLVIGCSSSEIAGGTIGHNSTYEYGEAAAHAALKAAETYGFDVAFQCCEHLNRALVMEQNAADRYGYEQVCAVPRKKAGGSFATAAWKAMKQPILVESVRADAGLDIGSTLIGMHLRRVAVPVRLSSDHIGEAFITAARTRAPLIGGERACYTEED